MSNPDLTSPEGITLTIPEADPRAVHESLKNHLEDHLREDPRLFGAIAQLQDRLALLQDEVETLRSGIERKNLTSMMIAGLCALGIAGSLGMSLASQHALSAQKSEVHRLIGMSKYVQATTPGRKALLVSAQASFEAAISANPDSPDAHFNLGVVLDELGKRKEAAKAWRKTIALAGANSVLGRKASELLAR